MRQKRRLETAGVATIGAGLSSLAERLHHDGRVVTV